MDNNEIIFSYNHQRCHAIIIEDITGDDYLKAIKEADKGLSYIGKVDDYYIYQIKNILFDQFGFIASKKQNP